MGKLNKLNKLIFGWQLIASILLGIVFVGFYTVDLGITTSLLFTVGGSLLIASLVLYETKVHLSIMLLFASELVSFIAYLVQKPSEAIVTAEFSLAIICLFSGLYLIIRKLKKSGTKLNINNIVYTDMSPFKIPVIAKVIVVSIMITVVFTMANSYLANNINTTLMSIVLTLLPTFIIMFSIFPIRETVYIRIIYYVLEVSILVMAVNIGKANIVMFIQPTVYIMSIVIGRLYRLSNEQATKVEIQPEVEKIQPELETENIKL